MAFMLAVAKPSRSPRAKAAETAKAQLMTLPGIHPLHHADIPDVVGKRCHHAGCRDVVHISTLPTLISGFYKTASQQQHHRIRPNSTQEIEPITSMARITPPGSSPRAIKRQDPVRDQFPAKEEFHYRSGKTEGDQCNQEFGEDLEKPLIIFSGMNSAPAPPESRQ